MTTTKGPLITLALTFSATPDTAHAREMEPRDLYQALDDWTTWCSIDGCGNNEAAAMVRDEANRQLGRIRRELIRRNLPADSWEYDAQLAEEAAADENKTRQALKEAMQ